MREPYTEMDKSTQTKLALISERARKEPKLQFISLAHLLNVGFLKECYYSLGRDQASGIDGVSWKEYGRQLDENLTNLVARMKVKRYKPQPAKRVYIPKNEHEKRPLGLPALEDKIVQKGIARILEAIYEADFLDYSYGFRPARNCHQAINAVDKTIMTRPIGYVIEADIKGYFDNVSHKWMMEFLQVRINNPSFLLLIRRYERENAKRQNRRANTFDFLGFTHYCDKSRKGKFIVGRKTSRKKFRMKCKEMNNWLRKIRNYRKAKEWWPVLQAKLRGHYQYYGVSGNMRSLRRFYSQTLRMTLKWLNRRSQRKSFNWTSFERYLEHYPLPEPRIVHNLYTLSPVL